VEIVMSSAFRFRPHALAAALALFFFAAGDARAQCLITGGSSLCDGPVQLCGPDGLYEWVWTDPAGNQSYEQCLTAATPGVYSLELHDMYGASFGPCTVLLQAPEPPPCAITGPATACEGSTVELCGPQGEFGYAWSGPNGFTSSAPCVQVSVGGTYALAVRRLADNCPASACEHTVTFEACRRLENCPRPAWFWMRQCLAAEPSGFSLDPAQLAAIAARVDARARIFDWQNASAGFCAALHPRPATLRARAKRQFAAVHANVCSGELGLPSIVDHPIALDPATNVQLRDVSTTVGEWLASADAGLVELESLDRGTPAVKEAYRRIIRAGWHINHGRGIGPVCGRGAAERDVEDDAAVLVGESEEPLAVEMADDEADRPEIAKAMPNPFSAATTITYAVSGSEARDVAIAVYDLSGRMVRELARGPQAPGVHEVRWDGRGSNGARVRSGVYFVRGLIGDQRVAGQLTVLR